MGLVLRSLMGSLLRSLLLLRSTAELLCRFLGKRQRAGQRLEIKRKIPSEGQAWPISVACHAVRVRL